MLLARVQSTKSGEGTGTGSRGARSCCRGSSDQLTDELWSTESLHLPVGLELQGGVQQLVVQALLEAEHGVLPLPLSVHQDREAGAVEGLHHDGFSSGAILK